nr:hypothetical protein DWF04_04410 [Cereibacter sphaeroides f. sp. denitrificans]
MGPRAAPDRMLDPAERGALSAAGASTAEALAARKGPVEAAKALAALCGTAIARGRQARAARAPDRRRFTGKRPPRIRPCAASPARATSIPCRRGRAPGSA